MAFKRLVSMVSTQAMRLLAGSTEMPGVDDIPVASGFGSTSDVVIVIDIDGDPPNRTYKLQIREGNTLVTLAQVTR